MKIVDINENLFDNIKHGDTIAHGANCIGVMGAGIAKSIKEYSKENFEQYKKLCMNFRFLPGQANSYRTKDAVRIYNLATQDKPGKNATIENVYESVVKMITEMEYIGRPVVKTVRLGCGIGGLNWEEVKPILEAINTHIVMEVYYI